MRTLRLAVLILTATLAAVAQMVAPALHILAPRSGESISTDFVTVQYELASPVSASSTPTFQLRLDTRDPVQTTDTQFTFTGLPTGTHTITIQVVDANNTPLPGVRNQVQFTVQPAPLPQGAAGLVKRMHLKKASMTGQQAPNPPAASEEPANAGELPVAGSALPLLSVIGMGVLVGGIASALRTRHNSNRS